MKGSAVALFFVNPMYSVNFMSVKVMLHCILRQMARLQSKQNDGSLSILSKKKSSMPFDLKLATKIIFTTVFNLSFNVFVLDE